MSKQSLVDLWKELYQDKFFYQLYFQKPKIAEAELEKDVRESLRIIYHSLSGDAPSNDWLKDKPSNSSLLDQLDQTLEGMEVFEDFPGWFTPKDLDYFVSQFEMSGLRGPFNRYRAQNIDWHELTELEGKILEQPAFFITGSLDPVNFFIPSDQTLIDRISPNYKELKFAEEFEGIGHWTQTLQQI
jgi:hypothetical protein